MLLTNLQKLQCVGTSTPFGFVVKYIQLKKFIRIRRRRFAIDIATEKNFNFCVSQNVYLDSIKKYRYIYLFPRRNMGECWLLYIENVGRHHNTISPGRILKRSINRCCEPPQAKENDLLFSISVQKTVFYLRVYYVSNQKKISIDYQEELNVSPHFRSGWRVLKYHN